MQIKVEIKRLKELVAAFEKAPKAVQKEMRLALKLSLQAIQLRARIDHKFRSKTGNVERSVATKVISAMPPVGRVFLDEAIARHALFIHEGTRAHPIGPKNKKALRWVGGGGLYVFSKSARHPGTRPDPFLYKAAEAETTNINDIFDRHIAKAIESVNIK